MPADERIKVIFKRVEVNHDGDWIGSGEWYFMASVDGQRLARPGNQTTSIRDGDAIALGQDFWTVVVDVRNKTEVLISFEAFDSDTIFDDPMGRVRYTLRKNQAWRQTGFTSRLRNYTLRWEVQLSVGGAFGRHAPASVFATRRNVAGGVNFSTVRGIRRASRLEICPVWPVPPDANLPTRPPPAGIVPYRNGAAKVVVVGDNINAIPNPAVIPRLSSPAPVGRPVPALPAGAPPRATAQNAARIEATYYYPTTLNFNDNDPRLEWEAAPANRIGFIGGNTGLKVMVYGKNEGNVVLTVKFQGATFAQYRAEVRDIKKVPFRANILNGPGASKPRTRPQDAANHITISNLFLRQFGIEVVPDSNVNRRNGARTTGHNGIYRISVRRSRTRNVGGSHPRPCPLNSRPNVLNIQYIHSIQTNPGWLVFGWAADRPAHPNHPSVSDNLVPTPSWITPTAGGGCGVPPDANPAGAVSINLLGASNRPRNPNLSAVLITNDNGDPTTAAGARMYGNVIAHELAHVLGLRHRVGGGPDGSGGHPPQENIMCQGQGPTVRQDFDRVQVKAIRAHPLVP